MQLLKEIKLELQELENLGVSVPKKAYELLKTEDVNKYLHMKVSDATDLILELSLLS